MALLLVVHGGCAISPENRDPLFRIALLKPGIPARDDASSNCHPAPSILFEHDLRANAHRVYPEGKPVPAFPDHAPGALSPQKGSPAKKTGQYLTRCGAIYSENAKKQWFVWHLVS
ncbi:hypothetical protein [Bradyrhizobium algeriense]|uniref:hypothetical protein n=1 Tax=Bradyrhizobium algeriense TaxID=634784 RepID=UPI0011AE4C54|nr:hypothetical protein [Bradyrhizobium algeriense]